MAAAAPVVAVVRTAEEVQKGCEEELRAALRIGFSVDLAFAAKRQLGFLRTIDSLPCLHKGPAVLRAIRRFGMIIYFMYYFGSFSSMGRGEPFSSSLC